MFPFFFFFFYVSSCNPGYTSVGPGLTCPQGGGTSFTGSQTCVQNTCTNYPLPSNSVANGCTSSSPVTEGVTCIATLDKKFY